MSRPKSEASIALERDRAIRKQRREQKRIEREARRAERAKKRQRHELCQTRKLKPVKSGNGNYSLFDAVHYKPMQLEDCRIEKGEE